MIKAIDPTKCPICGEPNECAMEIAKATGKPQEPCWCFSVKFSEKILSKVPSVAHNKACICKRCVAKEALDKVNG